MEVCWDGAGYVGALGKNGLESLNSMWGGELQLKLKLLWEVLHLIETWLFQHLYYTS